MQSKTKTTDEYLASLPEWQRDSLTLFRTLVHKALPQVREEIKWGVPAFVLNDKVIFTMGAFKSHVKYNFISNGALLNDVDHLFNNGLESQKSRSIDLQEGDVIDSSRLTALIKQATE